MSAAPSVNPLADLLVAVISGGRPKVEQRPTERLLPTLDGLLDHQPITVVRESEATDYVSEHTEIVTYPDKWATEYAASHWTGLKPFDGKFFGAFVGREAACLEAERRGCWGVLQLDDNIVTLIVSPRGGKASSATARKEGGLGMFAQILSSLALSTNACMIGPQLTAVPKIGKSELVVTRPGFPYSLFVEKVGPSREHWYGPFEDDITHAFQYGTRAESGTAAVVPMLAYMKESRSGTGMRAKYDPTRAVRLQQMFPESAKVIYKAAKANGRGEGRVFHQMLQGAIRTPVVVTDPALFTATKNRIEAMVEDFAKQHHANTAEKIATRTGTTLAT